MRRRLLTIAIFLLAGAAVNVAVAWGCAAWLPFQARQPGVSREYATGFVRRVLTPDPYAAETVFYHRFRRHGALFFSGIRGRMRGEYDESPNIRTFSSPEGMTPEALRPRWLQMRPYGDRVLVHRHVFAWGWPLLSLWCEHERLRVNPPTGYRVHGGIETSLERINLGQWEPYARVLPLRPIWPGFAVNTFFYAGILWLLIPGPFALRRLIRQRRGLCPTCAYPMGESAVCTECGTPIEKR